MLFYSLKSPAVIAAFLLASTSFITDASTSNTIRGATVADVVFDQHDVDGRSLSVDLSLPPKSSNKHHPVPNEHHHHSPPVTKTKKHHSPPTASAITKKKNNNNKEDARHGRRSLHEFQSRIVGGGNAPAGAYKFMVNWAESCGGSLIAPDLVLTAAHCAGAGNTVRIGSDFLETGGVTRLVSRECPHPNYDDDTTDNDYLIIQLSQSVDINTYKPIQLNSDASQPSVNDMLTVIGFGALSEGGNGSNRLQQVQVPTNSHATCTQQYPDVIESIHLCAGYTEGGKDSCQGDSGGPIFEMRNSVPVQVGVVSFGDGCARPNASGVYARVSGAYDWIQTTMASLQAGKGCNGDGGGGGGGGGGGSGGGGGGDPNCADEPSNWHDNDGTDYDCSWYADGDNCNEFGNDFPNFGKTAKQACCVCGGGRTASTTTTTTTSAPPPPPTTTSSAATSTSTSSSTTMATTATSTSSAPDGTCQDTPNWHDSDGSEFDCTYYAEDTNCADFGDDFENFGQTANQACCICGGGSTGGGGGGSGGGGGGGGGSCSDSPSNWHDSEDPFFDCAWYARGQRCARFGDDFRNMGKTANEACCACGGGASD